MVSEVTCSTCGGSLRGPYVAAHGQNYHFDHFRCTACATALDPQETNYWCEELVYCRFHYSTRFAPKCPGCTTAVLAHSIPGAEGQGWHPECYAINKFWGVKLAPPNREALKLDTTRRQYEIEEQSYDSKALISEQAQVQDQAHRIWDHLSTYEISLAICLKSCISSILGLSADRGVHTDSETWWTKLKLHCDALLHAIHAFAPPPPTSAELQTLGQALREQIHYLYASCSPSSIFKVDKLVENHMIHLIHDILSRVLSSTLRLTRQQRDPRLTKVFELLDQLRQAITEQPSSLPLVDPDDFKAVHKTPPFDTLGWNWSIESRCTHVPEVAGPLMPQPVIPVHLGIGAVGPLRGTAAMPPRQTGVVHRGSIRRPLAHAAPGAVVMTVEDLPPALPVKKDPPKPRNGNTRGKSIPLGRKQKRRATTPPPAVVKGSRPKSPQIVTQRSSSRARSRPRQSSNASVASAERAPSKAQAPVRKSRSRSVPRRTGRAPRPETPLNAVKRKSRNPAPQPLPGSVQPPTVVPRSRPRRSSRPRMVHMETAHPVVKPTSNPSTPALGSPLSISQLSDNLPSSRDLFRSAPSSVGALTMSIAQLRQYLSSTPSGEILSLVRHKEIHGVKHEFLVMRIRGPRDMNLWLRVERAAKRAQSGIRSLLSTFGAKDTARISGSEQEILREEEPSMVEADIRFESPPTLLDLEKLLTIVTEESVDYKLWADNCFFFAAAIQENLSARHGGYLFSGKQVLKNLAQDVRARIRARFEAS